MWASPVIKFLRLLANERIRDVPHSILRGGILIAVAEYALSEAYSNKISIIYMSLSTHDPQSVNWKITISEKWRETGKEYGSNKAVPERDSCSRYQFGEMSVANMGRGTHASQKEEKKMDLL